MRRRGTRRARDSRARSSSASRCSVSAIRGGGFPSRGSGVTVFVTNASSARATSGAVSASRQPEPLRIIRACRSMPASDPGSCRPSTGPSTQSRLRRAVDLDDAAVARAVAARHRRLPGELRARGERRARPRASAPGRRRGRRSRARMRLGDVRRLDHDLGVRDERRRLGVPAAAEAEHAPAARRAAAERYGSGAMPIPPPTRSGRSTSSRKPLPSGPSTSDPSPASSSASARVPGPIGSRRNASSPARREAERSSAAAARARAPRA